MRVFCVALLVASLSSTALARGGPPSGKKPGAAARGDATASRAQGEAPAKDDAGHEAPPPNRAEICHWTEEGTFKTLRLPEPAVDAHLRHGDVAGPCEPSTRGS